MHCVRRWRQSRTRLSLLLTVVWTVFTLDQLCLLVYTATYKRCRYPFLHPTPFPSWPNCVAPWFLTALIMLQGLGAAMFVIATISRFQDAFALLSTRHLIICRILTVLVAIVATVRFISALLTEIIWDRASRVLAGMPPESGSSKKYCLVRPKLLEVGGGATTRRTAASSEPDESGECR
ncbi:hypothetical protein AMAG_20393 [Allomyces macrogynus ATCC 38327]|uniref:Uncharacterized protein n=1 Tax=Allomyces macrogynus (strain ATCC 38327) TaxID=578462 RepID=A0A0L0T9Y8_ALLM3|nr:hypothetical protein AMAG_20393 [Allomyces macrogynus ATCC 38327]|eukprot:KNE71557.1 hypothetical protein AMAG_20393 [Allomyces macrogynus ATCC 38327]